MEPVIKLQMALKHSLWPWNHFRYVYCAVCDQTKFISHRKKHTVRRSIKIITRALTQLTCTRGTVTLSIYCTYRPEFINPSTSIVRSSCTSFPVVTLGAFSDITSSSHNNREGKRQTRSLLQTPVGLMSAVSGRNKRLDNT